MKKRYLVSPIGRGMIPAGVVGKDRITAPTEVEMEESRVAKVRKFGKVVELADEENKKGIVKLVNAYPLSLPKADRLILAFPDGGELENIDCDIPFLYTAYPELEVLNDE